MFSLAIRKKDHKEDFFWNHDDYKFVTCKIDCKGRYWLADPFLFEKDGIAYVFFEAFDLIQNKGKIGYCIYEEDGRCSDIKIVIDEPYHLSFPNIFIADDEILMMPESSVDYTIKLFKAVSFPDKWEFFRFVDSDVYACDSIFIEDGGKRYLLTNRMYHRRIHNTYPSCWVKNYLYRLDGYTTIDDGVKISEGDFGIRNAGKVFAENGILKRIGQDCRNEEYGRGLVQFRVNSLEPYQEEMLWSKDCIEMTNHIQDKISDEIIGVHTYNFTDNYEVIDYSYNYPVNRLTLVKREFLYLYKRVRSHLRSTT